VCAQEAPINRLVSDSHEFDPLTGALTRRALVIQTLELLEQSPPRCGSLAVGAIEIDRFASLEATLGQDDADALLVETACVLQQHLAESGAQFSRWDHGLFVILMPGANAVQAGVTMERIRNALIQQASGFLGTGRTSAEGPNWSAGVAATELGSRSSTQQGVNLIAEAIRSLELSPPSGAVRTDLAPQRLAA
jgi:diguanylate cyclase (GGDEF)-like protein